MVIVRNCNPNLNFQSIRNAVARVQSNTNAIKGLLGEQRVRNAIPERFQDNVMAGCWLVSNYTGQCTRHLLFLVHIPPADEDLPSEIKLEDIPNEIIQLSTLAQNLGIPTYYCLPHIFNDRDLPSDNATNAVLNAYLTSQNLSKTGNKQDKIDRINSIFSKIQYGCVNLATPESINSLPSVLNQHNFPEKRGGIRRFASSNPEIIDDLNEETIIEEFWKRHLWWKLKSLTSSHCADIDALYFSNNDVIPLEIKTKSIAGIDTATPYFGIDVGTIAKMLKFSQLGTGGGEGIYIVEERQGDDPPIDYHITTMSNLYANMELHTGGGGASGFGGGGTEVVKVPMHTFNIMSEQFFETL